MLRIPATALLVAFTAGDGQKVAVNPDQVVAVRGPSQRELLTKNVRCVLGTTDGRFISVTEECVIVRQMLEEGKQP